MWADRQPVPPWEWRASTAGIAGEGELTAQLGPHTQHGGFVFPKLSFLPLIVHLRLNPISYANVPSALGDFVDMHTHFLTVRPLDRIVLTFNTQRFALDRPGAFSLDAFRIGHLILT